MEELRLVLLGAGALLVAGVAGWEIARRRGRPEGIGRMRARAAARLRALRGRLGRETPRRRPSPSGRAAAGPSIGDGLAPAESGRTIALGDLSALATAAAVASPRRPNGRARGNAVPGAGAQERPDPPDPVNPITVASAGVSAVAATGGGPAPVAAGAERLLVVLTVMAPEGELFAGPRIASALAAFDLEFGQMGLFHHFGGRLGRARAGGEGRALPVFSVANAIEPGTFEPDAMSAFATPGLCLFLQLPGPLEGPVAFELMLDVGRKLAGELGGELRDERRGSLTPQGVQQIRERVVEHAARARGPGEVAGSGRVLH